MIAAPLVAAEFYKWKLPDGSIEYSDRPPVEDAEKVELKPLMTYTPTPASAPSAPPETENADVFQGYEIFTITFPPDESAIRDNAGDITIQFGVSPGLLEGHAIDVFMDEVKLSRSTGAAVTLSNVDRGSHQIHAAIVDQSGAEVARTDTITVHLRRASALF